LTILINAALMQYILFVRTMGRGCFKLKKCTPEIAIVAEKQI